MNSKQNSKSENESNSNTEVIKQKWLDRIKNTTIKSVWRWGREDDSFWQPKLLDGPEPRGPRGKNIWLTIKIGALWKLLFHTEDKMSLQVLCETASRKDRRCIEQRFSSSATQSPYQIAISYKITPFHWSSITSLIWASKDIPRTWNMMLCCIIHLIRKLPCIRSDTCFQIWARSRR